MTNHEKAAKLLEEINGWNHAGKLDVIATALHQSEVQGAEKAVERLRKRLNAWASKNGTEFNIEEECREALDQIRKGEDDQALREEDKPEKKCEECLNIAGGSCDECA